MSYMSGIPKRYCVFGCDFLVTLCVPVHRFPNPEKKPDVFNAWISVFGDKLKETDRMKIYKSKRVCDHHFDSNDKMSPDRIKPSAVPSVNLHCIHQGCTTFLHADHCYTRPLRQSLQSVPLMYVTKLPGPSTLVVDSAEIPLPSGSLETTCLTTTDKSQFRKPRTKFDAEAEPKVPEAVFSWQTELNLFPLDDVVNLGDDVLDLSDDAARPEPALYRPAAPDEALDAEYQCNECQKEITGFRYTCLQCADWDLCGACEARAAHAAHYLLRIPRGRPYNEVEAALAAIRLQLLSEGLLPDINDRVSDVKSEIEETPEIGELDPLGDHYEGNNNAGDNNEGDNNEVDNNEGDNNEGDNNAGDNNEGDNNAGDNNEDDCTIETDIIPHVIGDAELPLRKRPRLGSSHCSEPDLLISDHIPKSPRDRTTVAPDNSSPHNHDSTKSVEDIHSRKLHDKPSIPIVKLIRRSETSHHAGRIPLLKRIAEASVPLELRVIKPRAGNLTSGLRQERPIVSPSEDNVTPQRTDRSSATTAEVTASATIIPKLDRIANAKVSSRLILRVPIGTNRAVVRALKSKVSVRLKRIDVSKWKCKTRIE